MKTLLQVNEAMAEENFSVPDTVVMIQCVGSREEEHQYCSRVCCAAAVKTAIAMKEKKPDARIFILYRDMRTYGFREEYYTKAREMGITFVQYNIDKKPEVREKNGTLSVDIYDKILQQEIEINPDMVVLSARIDANKDNPEPVSYTHLTLPTN